MNMHLTRRQELALIQIGLESIVEQYLSHGTPKPKSVAEARYVAKKPTRKWSKQQRARFIKTMRQRYPERYEK